MHPRARELIKTLQLEPHPEGGFYREIYRSTAVVHAAGSPQARCAVTTIYFLLPEGSYSRWHRVASDEIWHLYEGGPLELMVMDPSFAQARSVILQAASPSAGPVDSIAANDWQAAAPLGAFALVGCTVAPGFEFADFTFLRGQPDATERVTRLNAKWTKWL